ncbi:MAG: hypothetical protein H6807_16865 [Planctomycetes bacterium]|nr:hypothetical protein [Planctomycetota bacterium]
MKRIVLVLVALAIAIPALRSALRSDEDRIRDLVAEAIDAFNHGEVAGVVDPLATEFLCEGDQRGRARGLMRGGVRDVLVLLGQAARDERGFTLEVVAADSSADPWVTVSGEEASWKGALALMVRRGDDRSRQWLFDLELDLEKKDGWRIVRARLTTQEGAPGY